nr:TRAP transporter small permease [Desulfobotulus pelophilus]
MTALLGLFVSVVLRYCFHITFAGADELVRNTIILTTFIGLSAAIRKDRLIRVDAMAQLFPGLRFILTLISQGAVMLFAGLLIRFGMELVIMMHQTGQNTIIWNMPLWILYAILPVSGVLMAIRTAEELWKLLCQRPNSPDREREAP